MNALSREQALKAFKTGCISLEERASVDLECEATLQRIREVASAVDAELPDDVQLLCKPPVTTYHINLSGQTPSLVMCPIVSACSPLSQSSSSLQ